MSTIQFLHKMEPFTSARPGMEDMVMETYTTHVLKMAHSWNRKERNATIPSVSPDEKYLFFMSRRNGIGKEFWVSAKIIEDLNQKN